MKKTLFTTLSFLFVLGSYAQDIVPTAIGGEYIFNPGKVSCITHSQRTAIDQNLQKNKKSLHNSKKLIFKKNTQEIPSFIWPVKQAEGFTYNDVWAISNYIDHSDSSEIIDYNCGNKSYNGHNGIDIYTWPFSWKQMDDEQADIIAAEAGIILGKTDGYTDQSCAMNGGNWNAVYVIHSDGSVAWYGHMKTNSLTTKNIGDTVAKGEFLGKVGSSGNSTGPHLHFEVYDADSNLIDPYIGQCNDKNTTSWWTVQQPYTQPNINAVLTHTSPPDFNDCPDVETANINSQFSTGDTVYGAIYVRDQEPDSKVTLRMKRPNGTYLYEWDFTFETYYSSSYWYWTVVPDVDGVWTWEAEYYGKTVSQNFTVGTLGLEDNDLAAISVYPNPSTGIIHFDNPHTVVEVSITDTLGKTILVDRNPEGIIATDLSNVAKGIYFVTLSTENNRSRTIKIVKD